jgi:hypothetical protein
MRYLLRAAALALGGILLLVLGVGAAVWLFGASDDEVARVSSPDGTLEAALHEANGGGATSFAYKVYVVTAGRQPFMLVERPVANFYGAVRSNRAYGVNLKWEGPNSLAVEYFRSQTASKAADTVHVGDREVGIVLREGVSDADAPPGGMLYNLKGRPDDSPPKTGR